MISEQYLKVRSVSGLLTHFGLQNKIGYWERSNNCLVNLHDVNHDEGFIEVKGRKNKEKKTDAQPKSRPIVGASSSNPNENKDDSPSRAKSGVISTPMSISFDVLNNLAEGDDEVQAKSNLNEPND
ncbi:hypothetical protein Tco_0023578 [Tanacetum coccineum]